MARDQNFISDSSSKVVSLERSRAALLPRRRRALLVVGMHRSGTSATTRMLNMLGGDLPTHLMPANPVDNPLGYFESKDLADLHDDLLESAGSAWDDVSPIPESWLDSDVSAVYLQKIVRILERNFQDSHLFVIKDPRLGRLVPLWLRALERFDATPNFILPLRNPLEVAASLDVRGGFKLAKSLLLWLSHVLETERWTRGHRRSIFAFDDLLSSWRGVVDDMAEDLELSWPRLSHRTTAEVEAYVSDRHRHHRATRSELESRSDVFPWVKEAYAALLELRSSDAPSITDRLDRIWRELRLADGAYGPVIADARFSLGHIRTEVDRLSGEVSARDGRVAELEGVLQSRQSELERLGGEVSNRDGRIADLEGDLSSRRSEVERLGSEVSARDGRVAELEGDLRSHQSELERRGAEISFRDGRVADLERGLSSRQAEVEGLHDEISSRDDRIAALAGEAEATSQEIEDFERELSSGRLEADRLRAQLVDSKSRREQLTRELTTRGHIGRQLSVELAAGERELARRFKELESSQRKLLRTRAQLHSSKTETEAVRLRMDAQSRELADSRTEAARALVDLEARRAEAAHTTVVARERQRQVAAMREESQRLKVCLEVARAEAESLEVRLGETRGELAYMTSCRSWRMTRPLRWLFERWQRVGR